MVDDVKSGLSAVEMKDKFLDDLNKALGVMKENQVKPFEGGGYHIFVNNEVGAQMKGYEEFTQIKHYLKIKNVLYNKKNRLLTVVFDDGEVVMIKCSPKDNFDVNIGVSLAITKRLYGSKNKFHKEVQKHFKIIEGR